MKRRKIVTVFLLLVLIGLAYITFRPRSKVDDILFTRAYSYLPYEAKNYVKEFYETTGEILKTEVNKTAGEPYLNPDFVTYLEMNDEEKQELEVIPESTVYDYVYNPDVEDDEYPSSFDLRNVDGKRYITPMKNQSTLGICWAFSATEQAESLLLYQKGENYTSNSEVFSPRQIDYGTSSNGINNYDNTNNGRRELTTGGNFFTSSHFIANGLGLVHESVMPFTTSSAKKELSDVFNYNNVNYEAISTKMTPKQSSTDPDVVENYTKTVKNLVYNYGGAVFSAQSPNHACGAKNSDGKIIVRADSYCDNTVTHAMQIIGWDDDYEYTYCGVGSSHTATTSTCSNVVTGKGAWIVRNSWGETGSAAQYAYIYYAYDSLNYTTGSITSLIPQSEKNWDNEYHNYFVDENNYLWYNSTGSSTFTKKTEGTEKLEKFKFLAYIAGTFSFKVTANGQTYTNIPSITADYQGINTVDVSSLNILVTDSVTIQVTASNGGRVLLDSISAFTSNTDDGVRITLKNTYIPMEEESKTVDLIMYSYTKNMDSGSRVNYELYDSVGNDVTDKLTYTYGIVAKNDINAYLTLKNIPKGVYTLSVIYNGYTQDAILNIGRPPTIYYYKNDGTEEYLTQKVTPFTSAIINNNAYTRVGYSFVNYNTFPKGDGITYNEGQSVNLTNDLTLYAIWTPITYTVKFNANNGSDDYDTEEFKYDEEKALNINKFTTNYKKFSHWNSDTSGSGTSYEEGKVVKNLSSLDGDIVNLYAIWESYNIEITYYANNGSNNLISKTHVAGENVELSTNTFTKAGYKFIGWNEKADGSGNTYASKEKIPLDKDLSLYAMWEPINYTVKFDANGGTGDMTSQIFTYDLEGVLNENKYTFNGHTFKEWNTASDGNGISYKDKDTILNITTDSEITLYAIWEKETKTITFNSNDGLEQTKKQNFLYNEATVLDENTFSRTGYTFVGWNTYADGSGTRYSDKEEVTFTDNLILYAEWEINRYNVTFYKNDGTEEYSTQEYTYNNPSKLNKNTFERDDYNFKEWNTKADGSGISYADEQEITLISDLRLYAQWTIVEPFKLKNNTFILDNNYIKYINVNTLVEEYKNSFELNKNYTIDIEYKLVNNKQVIYTGGRTRIYKGMNVYTTLINVVPGDTSGDGIINYLDYVNVYNHIQKEKHPESNKKLLVNEYLYAADMSKDNKVSYLDYVRIYNKIKELKGASN